ncbi:MAG: hypothetical protein A2149_09780 [Candidatus Schekmanbacteria bacterium RBG_16_38_11]|uniref:CN hydrolase domain-containing protein n=1 Tax=Candidatus Schekmanbacteria bacterium RBG_16_38_11 TaxID=1817880 RepID=A0A1F7RUP5_9BACT|nr:MAG: hypothetical protein A2149_09780 [Candidatus Schekmanbacteria bacterium RBG_16_38_11]
MMLKAAGIQAACINDKYKNLENAINLINMAVERGAQIIGLQELFNLHWFPFDINEKNFSLAEREDGKTIKTMQALAKEKEIVLICPIFEQDISGVYYNSAIVIDADGSIAGKYRKTHIPELPYWEEKYYFKPGNLGFPVFSTKYAKIGIQICWDIFFPEVSRILAMKGAEIIFSPTASDSIPSIPKWEKVIASNAITNNLFIFRINRVGNEKHHQFYGKSFCVNPEGNFICGPSNEKDSILIADIDLGQIGETRRLWTFIRDRREEIYGEIAGLSLEKLVKQEA